MNPARKAPNLWVLAGATYGLVAVVTIIALGAYYYMTSGTKSEPDRGENIAVGTVWVTMYPNAVVHNTTNTANAEATEGTLKFASNDAPGKVLAFYRTALHKSGYQLEANTDQHTVRAIGKVGKVEVTVLAQPHGQGSEAEIATVDRRKK